MSTAPPLRPRSGQPPALPGQACCVGHRGARAYAPENTLAAFRKAAAMGCTMIELDVHLSRDGAAVVHHDDRLARCTDWQVRFPGRPGDFVSDATLAELQQLDAGSWYARQLLLPAGQRQAFLRTLSEAELSRWVSSEERAFYASGACRVPTLAESLALAQTLDLVVNVEIKSMPRMYPGIAQAVVADVAAAGMQRSVLISSFDHEQLLAVKQLDASLPTGVLTSDRLARPAEYLQLLGADAHHPGCHGDVDSLGFNSVSARLDARGIDAVRAAGKMVFVWTCNEESQMRALAAAGVTGVITDYPNRWASALAPAASP